MKDPLYDQELDGRPPMGRSWDWLRRKVPTSAKAAAGKSAHEDDGGIIGEWFAGLSGPGLIGVGLAVGVLFSSPIVLAMRPGMNTVALLVGFFLVGPILPVGFRQLASLLRWVELNKAAIIDPNVNPLFPPGLFALVALWLSVCSIFSIRSCSPIPGVEPIRIAERQPRKPAAPPVPAVPPPLPSIAVQGAVVPPSASAVAPPAPTPAVVPPRPVEVPPLIEDPPASRPVVTSDDLKRLRREYRQLPVLGLRAIMDGVRRAGASNDWQRAGWRDYPLEFALDELIYRIKRTTERASLDLPVRIGALPGGIPENYSGRMTIARTTAMGRKTGCILIIDGDLKVEFAHGCLILATGEVDVVYGIGNVIVAGGRIKGQHSKYDRDGVFLPALLISGSRIELRSYCSDVICSAAQGVSADTLINAVLLNSQVTQVKYSQGCSEYSGDWLDFRPTDSSDLGGLVDRAGAGAWDWEGPRAPKRAPQVRTSRRN